MVQRAINYQIVPIYLWKPVNFNAGVKVANSAKNAVERWTFPLKLQWLIIVHVGVLIYLMQPFKWQLEILAIDRILEHC